VRSPSNPVNGQPPAASRAGLAGGPEDVPSAKLTTLITKLNELADEGHRALVFSQFTSYMKIIRQELEAAGLDCVYLDGSTRDRGKVLASFREGKAPVFLISLKAGGTGLTLTEADYVFVMDPWWNPAVEAQAVDRAHRIGQTKQVMVYRMVSEGTIEEKVMALKERKAALFDQVIGDGSALETSFITDDDIRGLMD
jgi:SNF2 family DNA or RNA helicase